MEIDATWNLIKHNVSDAVKIKYKRQNQIKEL